MTRIWFNRWFSVAYHYMNMIRNNADQAPFMLFGTHPDPQHMSLQAADYSEAEPVLEAEAYVEYALDFCKRHSIDIFIPRLHMYEIAQHADRFDAIGTKVMVCRDTELLQAIMEKDKMYALIQQTDDVVTIPDYEVVNTAEQFKQAYERITAKGHRVCFKPTNSEGGMGFRIIHDKPQSLQDLYGWVTLKMTFDEAYHILATVPSFDDIMVMELLEDDEYSIDCLASETGELITAIPRKKSSRRLYEIDDMPELYQIAERMAERYKIPYAYNIQVKYNKGIPKLLEINPRMSGGLYITCLTGVNIPYLAVRAVMGQQVDKPEPQYGIRAGYVEDPILITS
ncbi:ATP-grasp domain-containing protein [Paenibacillus sp. 481]|uniref:ATP-grasp domain-containing protein n=1 Tax=Paenibacillus sp. 481 TaxID=2835869 RepID=UPI001E35600A|nr:ATP-grasp domain-containing protein [Paenibacillus sp. 481]UHA74797.1 ATP-grasp domain-containing protein [Paenibacillus sp. 481]